MRLLHTHTLRFFEVVDHLQVSYAILSHRWNNDEVTFKDIEDGHAESKEQSFRKLQGACLQAKRDGHEYIWIDTCCIDKSSSAELSLAINSMFRWYAGAAVCYAYLLDVPHYIDADGELGDQISHSSWFTRGWTLQELVAPQEVVFFSADWSLLCRKSTHANLMSVITGVDEEVLRGGDFHLLSIAKRMSWASRRQTTRIEDQAYSLLGLFGINMPLLYGEGTGAFMRLQQEIIKSSDDHTIFAWGLTWSTRPKENNLDMLATSPAAFARSSDVVSCSPMKVGSEGRYCRTSEAWGHVSYRDHKEFKSRSVLVTLWAKNNASAQDIVHHRWKDIECWIRSMPSMDQGFQLLEVFPSTGWHATNRRLSVRENSVVSSAQAVMRFISARGDNLLVNFLSNRSTGVLAITTHTWHNPEKIRLADIQLHDGGFQFDIHSGGITDGYSGIRVRRSSDNSFSDWRDRWTRYPSISLIEGVFSRHNVDIIEEEIPLPRFLNKLRDLVHEMLEDILLRHAQDVDYIVPLLTYSEDEDRVYELVPISRRLQTRAKARSSDLVSKFVAKTFSVPTMLAIFLLLSLKALYIGLTIYHGILCHFLFTQRLWILSYVVVVVMVVWYVRFLTRGLPRPAKICSKTLQVLREQKSESFPEMKREILEERKRRDPEMTTAR